MKTKNVGFETRFGKEVNFKATKKVWTGQLPGEDYLTALVRCYYPRVYRRNQKLRAAKVAA